MYKFTYASTKTLLSDRIVAGIGAVGLVIGVGVLLGMKSDPVAVQIRDEQAVFVSLIDDVVEEPPKGEQTESLPAPDSIAESEPEVKPEPEPESEVKSEPEPEPEVKPEPEPVVEPEPEPPIVEEPPPPPPKPKPKPKPKPRPPKEVKKTVTVKQQKTDPNATTTKAFGIPTGKENAPAGGSANLGPVRVTSVSYLVRPKPVTPRSSLIRGERGLVIIRVVISTNGSVKSASIQKASPYSALNNEALRAVQRARFRPYTENGVPRESMADVPIEFK
ncbi:energy transducer TonB [Pelistega europaea]|uniref:Protein TonB n=1 Tax=Pelistega europaea TaxID=106147 RepID=A0A7Y4LBH3_9BURK|nr:energy transducer TonB [Pelistega europaea]NOL49506.1 energy transducer TonB [Pelistega europaea]